MMQNGRRVLGGGLMAIGMVLLCATASLGAPTACDPATEVEFQGHCYYLDGSNGACDAGYTLASQSVLSAIHSQFSGKTYKHQISDNCCIENADPVENWGMVDHCNQPGPFDASEPAFGGSGCTGEMLDAPEQLTLCVSTFTVLTVSPAPVASPGMVGVLALVLAIAGMHALGRSRNFAIR